MRPPLQSPSIGILNAHTKTPPGWSKNWRQSSLLNQSAAQINSRFAKKRFAFYLT
jgi:hypothetical protein